MTRTGFAGAPPCRATRQTTATPSLGTLRHTLAPFGAHDPRHFSRLVDNVMRTVETDVRPSPLLPLCFAERTQFYYALSTEGKKTEREGNERNERKLRKVL